MALVVYTTPLLGSAVAVGIPWLSAGILDDVVGGRRAAAVSGLYILALAIVGLYVVSAIRAYFTVKLAFLGTHRIRVDMVRAALSRSAPPDPGGFSMRVSQDAEEVGASLAVIPNLLVHGSMMVFIPASMFVLSALLASLVLPLLALVLYTVGRSARQTYPVTWLLRQRRDSVAHGLVDALSDLEQIKAQRLASDRQHKLWSRLVEHADARQYLARVESRFVPLISTSPLALQAVVLAVGAILTLRGQLGAGKLVGFAGLAALFLSPAQGLTAGVRRLQVARVSVERSFRLVDSVTTEQESEDRAEVIRPRGALHVRVETEGMDGQEETASLGLHVRPGEKVVIVGATGVGKSRLAAALTGVPNGSRYRCSASDRGQCWEPVSRFTGIRLLSHDRWYFGGTLRQNVTLGHSDISDTEIARALEAAGCTSFLRKRELTLDSVLDEHSVGLSGGERTRLSLARTIVGDPRLVVLDAPLAGLDPTQADEVHATLLKALPDATVVWLDTKVVDPHAFDRVLTLEQCGIIHASPSSESTRAPESNRKQAPAQDQEHHLVTEQTEAAPKTLVEHLRTVGEADSRQLTRWGERYLPDNFPRFGYIQDRSIQATNDRGSITPVSIATQRFRRSFLGILFLAAVEILAVTAIPWILRAALEEALGSGLSVRFVSQLAAVLVVLVVLVLARVIRTTSGVRLEERIDRLLKLALVRRVHTAPLRRVETTTTGAFLTAATQDTEAISKLSAQTLPTIGVNALIVVLAFVSMLVADWRLVLPVGAAFTLLTAFTLHFRRRSEILYSVARTAGARMVTIVTDTVRGHRDITAHRSARWFTTRAAEASNELHTAWLRAQKLTAGYFPSIQLAGNVSLLGLLALTLSSGAPPAQSIPTVVFFLTMLGLVASPIQSLAQSYDDLVSARVACDRLNSLLGITADVGPDDDGRPLPGPARAPDEPVIFARGVSLGIPWNTGTAWSGDSRDRCGGGHARLLPPIRLHTGEWLAVVGRSGTGKSTLLRALTGLAPPVSGTIVLLGAPVTELDQLALRRGCAYLPQSPLLTPVDGGTSHSPLLDRRVHRLSRVASEQRTGLSLGERQMLALHHALSHNPEIAFLDEPLSALAESEALRVLRDVRRSSPALSMVYVTHSAQLAGIADRVLAIDRS
ncbi:MAG TPA: ABC transporter ATP-binding protein [Mycobacteriales bacterium]